MGNYKTSFPEINLSKCESDGICVDTCPQNVLLMKEITKEEYSKLSLVGKLKIKVHGRIKAAVNNAENCKICSKCVEVCPEGAIIIKKSDL